MFSHLKGAIGLIILTICIMVVGVINDVPDLHKSSALQDGYHTLPQPKYIELHEGMPETNPLSLIDILQNDLIINNIADKESYNMVGNAKDVHICGNMAVEQSEYIITKYDYSSGICLLWCKYNGESHAQTWVDIDEERFILESTSHMYWNQLEHQKVFGDRYKICFSSLKKGKEMAKQSSEFWRIPTG